MYRTENYVGGAYDKCLHCEHLGSDCDGPRTSAMTIQRWCEWCRALKIVKGLTNKYIAEKSNVSEATVERVMSGAISKDISRFTMSAIENAIIGSSGKYPCAFEISEEHKTTYQELLLKREELAGLRKALESIHSSYEKELNVIRDEAQKKVDYLRRENERLTSIIEKLVK